jgi:hypothetical protein
MRGLAADTACRQLGDDIAYARWNFLGIGLTVRDGTLHDFKKCIDRLKNLP